MKNLTAFILSAVFAASAIASGTVTAPNGNVAIDTGGPFNYTLHLYSDAVIDQSLSTQDSPQFKALNLISDASTYGADTNQIRIKGGHGGGTTYAGIQFAMFDHSTGWGADIEAVDDTSFYGGALSLRTGSGSATGKPTERIRITSDGNVIIRNALMVGSSGTAIRAIHFGVATMNHGPVFISEASVTSGTIIICNYTGSGPFEFNSGGVLHYSSPTAPGGIYRSPGLGFWITSPNPNDINPVIYWMVEP